MRTVSYTELVLQRKKELEDWTITIIQYAQGLIRQLNPRNQSKLLLKPSQPQQPGQSQQQQPEQEKDDLYYKFHYVTNLIHWNCQEGLIDRTALFQQVLDYLKDVPFLEEVSLFLYMLFPYMSELCAQRPILELLLSICQTMSQKVEASGSSSNAVPSQAKNGSVHDMAREKAQSLIADILRYILITYPDLLAPLYFQNDSCLSLICGKSAGNSYPFNDLQVRLFVFNLQSIFSMDINHFITYPHDHSLLNCIKTNSPCTNEMNP